MVHERALHGRDHVLDMGELLDAHELTDLDRAEFADPSDIVSCKIDEHRVLGPLFFVKEHLLREPLVLA